MIHEITTLSDPRLDIFASLTEAQLRNRLDPTRGIFIAESPKVIRVALQAGYTPQALYSVNGSISRGMLTTSSTDAVIYLYIQVHANCWHNSQAIP